MRKDLMFEFAAIIAYVAGVIGFVVAVVAHDLPWNITPHGVLTATGICTVCFIIANLAVTALLWVKQNKSGKFMLDDLAFCSALTMGQGAALGVIVMLLMSFGLVMPEPLAVAIQHPTLGMVALGFIGMALFFALHCMGAISCKKWWFAVQAGSLFLIMVAIVLGCGSRFYLIPLSLEASEAWGWVAIAGLATALFSYFMQSRK